MSRVDRDQAFLASSAEAAGIARVHDDAAGEHHLALFFRQGDWKLAPMQQVRANGMSPAHVAPLIAKGIELEEKMIFPMKINEPIGIVRPVLARREVHFWAI